MARWCPSPSAFWAPPPLSLLSTIVFSQPQLGSLALPHPPRTPDPAAGPSNLILTPFFPGDPKVERLSPFSTSPYPGSVWSASPLSGDSPLLGSGTGCSPHTWYFVGLLCGRLSHQLLKGWWPLGCGLWSFPSSIPSLLTTSPSPPA